MYGCGFYCLINKPTRITKKSSKAIDHIWTNAIGIDIQGYLITSEIADHLLIMQISAIGKPNTRSKLNHRIITQKGLKKFYECFEKHDLSDILIETDPNKGFSKFFNICNQKFQEQFPIKKEKSKIFLHMV